MKKKPKEFCLDLKEDAASSEQHTIGSLCVGDQEAHEA